MSNALPVASVFLPVLFEQVREMQGIKQAEVNLDGVNLKPVRSNPCLTDGRRAPLADAPPMAGTSNGLKVAIAYGLSNTRILLEQIQKGISPYHFIEVLTEIKLVNKYLQIMACPGGCLGGGGQPMPTNLEIRMKKASALYEEDKNKPIRKSHQNPAIIDLYKEFLGKPLGEKSHHLLHTTYTKRERY